MQRRWDRGDWIETTGGGPTLPPTPDALDADGTTSDTLSPNWPWPLTKVASWPLTAAVAAAEFTLDALKKGGRALVGSVNKEGSIRGRALKRVLFDFGEAVLPSSPPATTPPQSDAERVAMEAAAVSVAPVCKRCAKNPAEEDSYLCWPCGEVLSEDKKSIPDTERDAEETLVDGLICWHCEAGPAHGGGLCEDCRPFAGVQAVDDDVQILGATRPRYSQVGNTLGGERPHSPKHPKGAKRWLEVNFQYQ